ncbi:hypothetical protein NBRC116188_17890 [Oceaniserpentilla sp. 4NH20-0058]
MDIVVQTLSFTTFLFAILFAFNVSEKVAGKHANAKLREHWLRKVNENIPIAIMVMDGERIIYKNNLYEQLQIQYKSDNPFGELDLSKDQQEIWLHNENGDGFGYWINKYNITNTNSIAFIITDITAAKIQGSFIQKIAQDLNAQNKNNITEMTRLIHSFAPSSILFVGAYNGNDEVYDYITHEGGANIPKGRFHIHPSILQDDDWNWHASDQLKSHQVPSIVKHSELSTFSVLPLKSDSGQPLGIILLIIPDSLERDSLSEILLDFLAIFSLRVKSELEHQNDKELLKQSTQQYKAIIESSNEAIVDLVVHPNVHLDESVDMQWNSLKEYAQITEVNSVFLDFFQLESLPSIEKFFSIKSIKHMLRYVLESGFSSDVIEVAHQKSGGGIAWLSCNAMADIEDRKIRRLWLIIRDITDSKNHIRHLEHEARHDKLTGLANRSALHDYLDEKIDQANQFGFEMALLLIDLNRFKEINDALGHHYGDVLLKKIEPRIRDIIANKRGFLARLGGDEFAIVIPAMQSQNEVQVLAQDIAAKLKEPFDLGKLNVEIGCSMGVAYFPSDADEASSLIRCADVAMYQAKKVNSRILDYRNEMDQNSPRRLALTVDMNKGLRNAEFFLVYQPKLDLNTNTIHSAEALIRWQHSELGLIAPSEFIPLAEMSDVIINMTHWVIDQALGQIKEWQSQGINIKTSVNVSTRNLLDEDLPEFIRTKLEEYQVPAHLLEIEITESALMVDPERALNTLKNINEMGVSISVDDFGTGYSSFIYLRQLPIDTLKIDIMFVRNMCISQQDEIIVNSIINLAHNLSLTVVAEGAETFATVERLREMNCNLVQGYYLSKPVPADEFIVIKQAWGD